MSINVTLYHNNRCSKSREALAWLEEQGAAIKLIHYLDAPPDAAMLRQLYQQLGLDLVRGMMRTKENIYAELGLANESLSEDDLLAAIAAHPTLWERPLAVVDNQAAIGRPLNNIMALLNKKAT